MAEAHGTSRRPPWWWIGWVVLVALPGVVGYLCLRFGVDYYGENVRRCTGYGHNRSCSDSKDSVLLQALFTGDVDHGAVSSQALLWVARGCGLLYALALVALLVGWLVTRVRDKRGLEQRKRRMGMRGAAARDREITRESRRS